MRRAARWGKRLLWLLPTPLALLCLHWSAQHPAWVERHFSRTWYPAWATRMSQFSARFSGSLAERLALLCAAAIVLALLARGVQSLLQRSAKPLAHFCFDLLCSAGALVAAFILLWGLHFVRLPFSDAAHMQLQPTDPQALVTLCDTLLDDAITLRAQFPQDAQGARKNPDSITDLLNKIPAAYATLAVEYPWLAGDYAPPKAALYGETLSDMQIMGIFIPYTGEALLNAEIPSTQLAHTAAHEAAHQRGFAREAEADYIGYLACMASGDAGMAYSGTLTMLRYAALSLSELAPSAYDALAARFTPGIHADYAEQLDYWQAHNTPLAGLVNVTNERYLHTFALKQSGRDQRGDVVALLLSRQKQLTTSQNP